MNTGERLACVETKIENLQKLVYILILVVAGKGAIDLIPYVSAYIG